MPRPKAGKDSLQQIVLDQLDRHMERNEGEPVLHTKDKNLLKMDQYLNVTAETIKHLKENTK